MKFKNYHKIVKEGFDITQLLTSPDNDYNSLRDILHIFERDYGGKVLGSGVYATVLSHPSWNYALKIFSDDPCYIRYVRYCLLNQNNPFVPKYFDKPRKILPSFKRRADEQNLYLVKMEILHPLKLQSQLEESLQLYYTGNALNNNPERDETEIKQYIRQWNLSSDDIKRDDRGEYFLPNFSKWFLFIKQLKTLFPSCLLDLHSENFMSRENSESLVLTDPFTTYSTEKNWSKRMWSNFNKHKAKNKISPSSYLDYDERNRSVFLKGKKKLRFENKQNSLKESFNSTLKINGKFETATVPDDSDDDSPFETEKTVLKSVQIIPFENSNGDEFVWYARQSRFSDNHWEVAFGKVKSFSPLTGYQLDVNPVRTNEYFKILSTVVEICNRFVQFDSDYTDNSVHTVSFTSKGDNRTNLYLKRLLPKIEDFQLSETSKEGDETTVILNRVKFW